MVVVVVVVLPGIGGAIISGFFVVDAKGGWPGAPGTFCVGAGTVGAGGAAW